MGTYKGIKGVKVLNLTSDPSVFNSGEVWFNTTSNTLKYNVEGAGAWASGTAMPTPRGLAATIGITTAGMVIMGDSPPAPTGYQPIPTSTTEWDGSNWTTGGAVNHGEGSMQLGFGTLTAGVLAGGYQQSPTIPALQTSEEYNGSSWTTSNNMLNTHTDGTAAGILTAGLAITGAGPSQTGAECEEYDGTSWTAGGALGTGRSRPQGSSCGTQTAALCVGGDSGDKTLVEQYNGTAWTAAGSLNAGAYNGGASGTQALALSYGGHPALTATESYNGSSWTTENTLATGRGYCNGMGTQASSMLCGGNPGGGYANTVEAWTDPVEATNTVTVS